MASSAWEQEIDAKVTKWLDKDDTLENWQLEELCGATHRQIVGARRRYEERKRGTRNAETQREDRRLRRKLRELREEQEA